MQTPMLSGVVGLLRAGSRLAVTLVRPRAIPALLACCALGGGTAAGNVVEYTYDSAGNVVGVQRQSTPGFGITGFSPATGAEGTPVTIYGIGFDPVAGNDTVMFNGVLAQVSDAASGSLSTLVPPGATTGRITVTVGGATATSGTDFVVTVPGTPTISSFTPGTGAAGDSVNVSGTNFDTSAGGSIVRLNGVTAAATVSSAIALSFPVPASTASGKITVATAGGAATSAGDFIVPPPGMTAPDIAATVRATPGAGNVSVAVDAGPKSAVVLFDAAANVFYSAQFTNLAISPTTAAVDYKVISPDNSILVTGRIGASNRPSIHLPKLATSGTYSIVLSPGNATFNTSVRIEVNPVITVDGPGSSSTMDFPYQSARFVFDAVAGQRIGFGVVGLSFVPAAINSPYNGLRIFRPDGVEILPTPTTCGGQTGGNPEGNCDAELLPPISGTYTAVLECPSNAYGNFSLQATGEVSGALSPDVTQTISLARVGQDARYTFSANAGDSFGIDVSNANMAPRAQSIHVTVYKPDGTYLSGTSGTPPRNAYAELGTTLPTSGTYTVFVDPSFGAYGTLNLTVKQGPLLLTSDPPSSFAPAGLTEPARFRFSGTAGQNLSVGVFDLTSSAGVTVYAPSGGSLSSASCPASWTRCHLILKNLPQTGTYSVVIQPPDSVKVSGSINLSEELVGTLTSGQPVTFPPTRPGQVARYAFSGTAGESTSVKLYSVAVGASGSVGPSLSMQVLKPDGTNLGNGSVSGSNTATLLNFPSLPVTGNYTVVLDPTYGASWQGTLELDPGTPIAVDGPVVSLNTGQAGKGLRYTFSAGAGQRIEFGVTGLAYATASSSATSFTAYSQTGAVVFSNTCFTSAAGCETFMPSAPVSGDYSLVVIPPASSSIVGGTVALSTPLSGSFVIGDPPQVLAITRPGQTARYTFAGTAGQLLRINWTSPLITGSPSSGVFILKPDGTNLSTTSMPNGTSGGLNVPSLPASGAYSVVLDPPSAATLSASMSLVTQ